MNSNRPGPGSRKWFLASALFAGLLFNTGALGGQSSSKPENQGKKVARQPRLTKSVRHDLSHALRDIPPKAPVRERPEREIRKPQKPRPLFSARRPAGKKQPDLVLQDSLPASNIPLTTQNFEGVGNVNGVLPPDTNGAVGPNHYVQWVNLSFAVYSKTGQLLYGPADGSTLWSGFGGACEFSNDGDPIVLHDDLADRWVMSQLAIPYFPFGPFIQCLAISQTPDPTGAYYRYEFIINEEKLNDYPKFGVWPDGYYMAVNQFDTFTSAFVGQGVVAFEREKMLVGQPAQMIYFDLFSVDPNLAAMLPAHADGVAPPPGSPNYFVQLDEDGFNYVAQDQLQLWKFQANWTNPAASTFTGPWAMVTAPFDTDLCGYARNCIPQPGTPRKVDAISDRLMYRMQYRNFDTHESLVVNHTVDVGGDHAGIRWYELRNPSGTPFLHQQGTYAPDSDHRWMGSVAMDGAGNMALGFSVASSGTFPSVRYTGRLASDPLGVMAQGESQIIAGSGSQTDPSGRWGDYSSMSLDPTDHCTFWYTQQYYTGTSPANWRTRVGSFSFPSCGSSLPSVTVAATASAAEAELVDGTFTFTRTGSTAEDLVVSFVVTGSATPGVDYVAIPSSVTIPAGSASATLTVTPIDDLLVEFDETVIVTLTLSSAHTVGTPSSAILSILSDDLPPDLVVTSLVAPTAGSAGEILTVTDTTRNQGGGAADNSTTRFYLSTNTLFDASDAAIGQRAIPQLAAGASSSGSTTVTIPPGAAGGNYYILAVADADNDLPEGVETNNVRSAAIQIGPDLMIFTLTAPATVGDGVPFSVTDATRNQGGGNAGATVTRFYLSTNTLLDAADTVLGERAVPALAAGTTNTASTTLTIAAGTPGGNYYILAKADSDNTESESQEGNNLKYALIQVGADLIVSALSAPSTGGAGEAITVTDTTVNQGGGPAAASTTRFYISTNTLLDASDTPLSERAVPALAAGATSSASTTLALPAGLAGGNYYVLAQADGHNVVPETIESNNVKYALIQIGADLIVSTLTVPPAGGAGAAIAVTDTTKNQGGGAAGNSVTRFYLSTNTLLDASDTPLGERSVGAIGAGAQSSASTTVTIPAGIAGGNYYILAQADADNSVAESLEGNNVKYALIQIGADLIVSALTVPASGGAGVAISVSDTTLNQGGGAAGASKTRFYLSTNTLLDATDTPLGDRTVPSLGPGASSAASTSLTIPAGTAGGSYYILAKADGDDSVAETLETNNLKYGVIQIGADLIVSVLTVPATGGAGASISISDTTRNQGGGVAGASTTRFYLSTNTTLDENDTPLGMRAVPALAASGLSSGSTTVTIPAGTAGGNYYILALADADNAISESLEGNNGKYALIQIGSDLAVTVLTAPATAGAGVPFNVSDTTKNQGGGTAGASTTRFYLSSNAILDAGDVAIGSRAVPALAPNAVSSAPTSVTIPAGTAGGSYFILAQADADDVVAEILETNNVKFAPIQIGADLSVTVLNAPASAGAGASITVTDTTKNLGAAAADPSTTRLYFSTNTVLDAGDTVLGERAVPALAPGAVSTASTSVTIPAGTGAGNYYILAKADADDVLAETLEGNNVRNALIQIGPDLFVSALTGPTSAAAGASITLNDSTKNLGGGDAGVSVTRFYLSVNALLDASDVPLGERAVPGLSSNATSSASTAAVIPAGTSAGTYYILAKADADDAVAEGQEANNVRFYSVTITSSSASAGPLQPERVRMQVAGMILAAFTKGR